MEKKIFEREGVMMSIITKPLLADPVKMEQVIFPVLASPKLDGIRCLIIDGHAMSRNFKPIGNNFIRTYLEKHCPDGFDGEIIIRNAEFCDVSGGVMRSDGDSDFIYMVFDYVTDSLDEPFQSRYNKLSKKIKEMNGNTADYVAGRIVLVPHTRINDLDELKAYEETCLKQKYEGVMVRSLDGPYKCGRSHIPDGILLKIKRFVDSEAEVIDLLPMMHNDNEAGVDAFGRTKRSHCQENMIEMDTLGKFVVKDEKKFPGVTFEIGTGKGLTQQLRKEIWDNKKDYKGKLVKYKYQDCGTKDAPRFPVWLGFRDSRDMD
jgi:DNA ligase-1